MQRLEYSVDSDHKTLRLDVFLSESQDELSRSRLKKLIEQGHVSVNDSPAQAKYKLKAGDKIILNVPAPSVSEVEAEPIPLNIIYEDEVMLAIDKPAGMVVHPAPGHGSGTLGQCSAKPLYRPIRNRRSRKTGHRTSTGQRHIRCGARGKK